MVISVASDKGRIGKTLVAANLAFSLKDRLSVPLLHCDVDASCRLKLKWY